MSNLTVEDVSAVLFPEGATYFSLPRVDYAKAELARIGVADENVADALCKAAKNALVSAVTAENTAGYYRGPNPIDAPLIEGATSPSSANKTVEIKSIFKMSHDANYPLGINTTPRPDDSAVKKAVGIFEDGIAGLELQAVVQEKPLTAEPENSQDLAADVFAPAYA